jgi:hypothetical protein
MFSRCAGIACVEENILSYVLVVRSVQLLVILEPYNSELMAFVCVEYTISADNLSPEALPLRIAMPVMCSNANPTPRRQHPTPDAMSGMEKVELAGVRKLRVIFDLDMRLDT